jgi:hypothetical protein
VRWVVGRNDLEAVVSDVVLDRVLYRVRALEVLAAVLALVRPRVGVEVLVEQLSQLVGKAEALEVARVAERGERGRENTPCQIWVKKTLTNSAKPAMLYLVKLGFQTKC